MGIYQAKKGVLHCPECKENLIAQEPSRSPDKVKRCVEKDPSWELEVYFTDKETEVYTIRAETHIKAFLSIATSNNRVKGYKCIMEGVNIQQKERH